MPYFFQLKFYFKLIPKGPSTLVSDQTVPYRTVLPLLDIVQSRAFGRAPHLFLDYITIKGNNIQRNNPVAWDILTTTPALIERFTSLPPRGSS